MALAAKKNIRRVKILEVLKKHITSEVFGWRQVRAFYNPKLHPKLPHLLFSRLFSWLRLQAADVIQTLLKVMGKGIRIL